MSDGLLMGKPPFLCILYGKKYSGKSVLLKHIIWSYRNHFQYIVVFSGTSDVNGAYDFLPKQHVHNKYEPEVMKSIIEKQKDLKKRGKDVQALIIFDDCLGNGFDWKKQKDSELVTLASSNRHWNISLAISTQGPRMIPPIFRNNVDAAFIHRSLNQSVDDLYQIYSTMGKKEWTEFVHKNTQNWRIIYFNAKATDPADTLSVFTIPEAFMEKRFKLLY